MDVKSLAEFDFENMSSNEAARECLDFAWIQSPRDWGFDLVIMVVDCPDESNNIDDPADIDAGDSSTSGDTGGSATGGETEDDPGSDDGTYTGGGNDDSNSNTNDGGEDNDNPPDEGEDCILDAEGNCIDDTSSLILMDDDDTSEEDCEEEISGLTEIINTPKIKAELTRLKETNLPTEEEGKRFLYTGTDISDPSTYNDASFDEQLPTKKYPNGLDFPELTNNTIVGAHLHPDFAGDPIVPIRRVPSGTDIAEHINMVKMVYQNNQNAASNVTNFVLSRGNAGYTYILRANNPQNIVENTKDYTKKRHKKAIWKKVVNLLEPYEWDSFAEHETAIIGFLADNFPDLDLYKAKYDENGNITELCKLQTQE